jgi:nicotinamide-nucleotide amidase
VKIMAKAASEQDAEALIAPLQAELERRLRGYVFGFDEETLESAVRDALLARGETIAVAESCTGGRIAAALTTMPGSSAVFHGGIVAYDNAVKERELDVPAATIAEHGAVSEETVRAMASGVRSRLGCSVGLATSGVAGPDGGSLAKPVGTVWFALASPDGTVVAERMQFRGDRNAVQARATTYALAFAWRSLTLAR